MILLIAVLAGLLAGILCAKWKGEAWHTPSFQAMWLVLLGFLPQLLTVYFPLTREYLPDRLASASLIFSQLLLLIFAFLNRRLPGMALLLLGLGFNFLVIVLNGGFMPLSVETASKLFPKSTLAALNIGERISSASKDILLRGDQIVFPWLADRFISPKIFSYRFAYSVGDIFISLGAFYLLAKTRSPVSTNSPNISTESV